MRTLDDKVVVLTGAGSGIGRALAVDLAGRGALLALSDVDEAGLAETVDLVKNAGAREVHSQRLDVADRDAMAAYAATVVEHFGRVNLLINNAGVSVTGDFDQTSYADLDWIMGINLMGVVQGTKEFLPHLVASGEGHVVTLSSLFGLISMPSQAAYNATKYAVRGFSESLRMELVAAGHPVGVTVVHPGGIRTAITRNCRVTEGVDKRALVGLFEGKLARMSPEKAAAVILDGVLKDKARVLVGADAHALHWVGKLLGSRYQDVVARQHARVTRRTRTS